MNIRVPLWAALAGCVACMALGGVRAQNEPQKKPDEVPVLTEYPYLPNRYGEAFLPSFAEWQALRVTALGASTTRITEQFSRQHLTCFATPKGLMLTLDLLPQPTWKHYAGGGKFSAPLATVKPDLQESVDSTMRFLRSFFPEVRDQDVTIRVFIRSERVGEWNAGKLLLTGEKSE